jgi:ACT domain-containing protein
MTAIVTVIGEDHKGIISSVSNYMSDNEINILDISQTIMQDYFTMIMLVDLTETKLEKKIIRDSLDTLGTELKVKITFTHQNVFDAMHRI